MLLAPALPRTLGTALLAGGLLLGTTPNAGAAQSAGVARNDDEGPPAARMERDPDPAVDLDQVRFELGGLPVHVVESRAEANEVVVEFRDQPGSRAVVGVDDLPLEARYRLREAQLDPSSRADWLELAAHAEQLGLRLRRYEALVQARGADDSPPDDALRKRLTEARAAIAEHRVQRARELQEDGDLQQALTIAEDTAQRFDQAQAAETAAQLADSLRGAIAERPERSGDGFHQEPPADGVQESGGEPVSDFDSALEDEGDIGLVDVSADDGADEPDGDLPQDPTLREATRKLQKGRSALAEARATEDHGQSRDLLQQSLESLKQAASALGGVSAPRAGEARDDDDVPPSSRPRAVLERRTRAALVKAHVKLGYLELLLGDQVAAYDHASRAAAMDPEDPLVSDLRQAVASADTDV